MIFDRNRYKLPGLVGMVMSNGSSAFVEVGVSIDGQSVPMKHTQLFHLGSCTKAMTATLLAIFIQRGAFMWETTLGTLFPELKLHPDYK